MELLTGVITPARTRSRNLASLIAAALLAGCAARPGAEPAQPSLTPEQQAWEEKIVAAPMFVSSEYFRQRAQPQPVIDTAAATRSQRSLEERVARLEAGTRAAPAPAEPGYVVRVSGQRLYTDLTVRQADVKVGATLSILSERDLVHPVTGQSLGRVLEEIGEATLVEAGAGFSVAEIVGLRAGESVKPKDRVRVRGAGADAR